MLHDLFSWIVDVLDISNKDGINGISEGYAILLTGVFGLLGWLISLRQSLNTHRKEKSHEYIIHKNEEFRKNMPLLRQILKDKISFPEYASDECKKIPQIEAALINVLSDLEVIALDIKVGHASERYIADAQRSIIVNLFYVSRSFIASFREKRKQNSLFRNYEMLYVRIFYKRIAFLVVLIEFIINTPLFKTSFELFKIKYRFMALLYNLPSDYKKVDPEYVKDLIQVFQIAKQFCVLMICITLFLSYDSIFSIIAFIILF